ncbi:gluconate:proton symporter [Tetragenococcus osmophilus]|uniref:Gluconate:proton symporter n=2 Tax=Tetragenococcus TaxID=51668 RepID=A0AA38CWJ7_9ENTE|nr:SLC13 family permease [Tetragenococcus osmophilus]AYW48406.1 gluconate:proton symporter [Tetragenococcus osmophilus]GMA54252.1 gluconate:proton symporter [Alicyclobacillus contaminans]GMA71876.1 gluconate:proton symporter [Tetragenococcus osmophilus]
MDIQVSALGAIIGLLISIVFIFMKAPPVYGLFVGALAGGMIGGASLEETIELMISGAQDMITAILRILAAGILAGVLIKTGGAESIARTIIHKIGETRALFALALATLILTAVGVFVDIAVVTVAPIALVIAKNANISKTAILLAMVGGGKAGNIMSPNPNTIALSDAFATPLTSVMLAGVLPGIVALFFTYFLAKHLSLTKKDAKVALTDIEHKESPETKLPSFKAALSAPLVAVVLLSLRPTFGIEIDPMVALPLGGIAGSILMGQFQGIIDQATFGLSKMSNVAVLLIGTGLIAGVITNSTLGDVLIRFISDLGLPVYLLAPLAGTMMSAATASTTSGAIVAGQVFNTTLLESGISGIAGAAMIHAGATVLDHMPHGSFYHATGGSVQMSFKARLKVVPYETLVGLVITAVSVIMFGVVS